MPLLVVIGAPARRAGRARARVGGPGRGRPRRPRAGSRRATPRSRPSLPARACGATRAAPPGRAGQSARTDGRASCVLIGVETVVVVRAVSDAAVPLGRRLLGAGELGLQLVSRCDVCVLRAVVVRDDELLSLAQIGGN